MKNLFTLLFVLLFFSVIIYSQNADLSAPSGFTVEQKEMLLQQKGAIEDLPVTTTRGIIRWSEGFEGATFPPAGWAVHQLDGGANTWLRYTSTPIAGTASASVRWESTTLMNDDWLVTPQFIVNSGDLFRFYSKGSTTYYDSVQIYVSSTGGTPPTGYTYITTFRPTTLAMYEVPLNAYAGMNVYMAFRYYALNELRVYIDSVYVETPVDLDAGIASIGGISSGEPGIKTPTAEVKNYGALTQSFNVTLQITGGYTSTQSVTNLAPGAIETVTFANWDASSGSYTAKVFTQLPGDMNTANDTLSKNINIYSINFIYNNGPFVTNPGGGAGGADLSALVAPLNVYGFGVAQSGGFRIADDFTVPADTVWSLNAVEFFAYQTGSTLNSSFTFGNFRIWNGHPANPASSVIFGDNTTNNMAHTSWTNSYRSLSTTPTGSTRPIMSILCLAPVTLQPGTYWIDFQLGGTIASGPWAIPVTALGELNTGNAIQYSATAWSELVDSVAGGIGYRQGITFKLSGAVSIVPVELASFKADVNGNSVSLNWITATETNNRGFEVERSFNGNAFEKLGFVSGNGTTTEIKTYSFADSKLASGKYSYRLKQLDYDGTYEYSNTVEVDIIGVTAYSLDQNYPNPFNPSTVINFTLPADSRVSLRVFDILGQEVAVIVNAAMTSGAYTYSFDASNLNSGVYFYQLEAQGNDGSNFKSIKKMMLTK
jgi:hypothetical protein